MSTDSIKARSTAKFAHTSSDFDALFSAGSLRFLVSSITSTHDLPWYGDAAAGSRRGKIP